MKTYPWAKPALLTLAWVAATVPAAIAAVRGERQLAQRLHEEAHPTIAVFSAALSVASWMAAVYGVYYLGKAAHSACAKRSEKLPQRIGMAQDLESGLLEDDVDSIVVMRSGVSERVHGKPLLSGRDKIGVAALIIALNISAAILTQFDIKDWVHQADNPGHFVFNNGLFVVVSAALSMLPIALGMVCYVSWRDCCRAGEGGAADSSIWNSDRTSVSESGYVADSSDNDDTGGTLVSLRRVDDDGHVDDRIIHAMQFG